MKFLMNIKWNNPSFQYSNIKLYTYIIMHYNVGGKATGLIHEVQCSSTVITVRLFL